MCLPSNRDSRSRHNAASEKTLGSLIGKFLLVSLCVVNPVWAGNTDALAVPTGCNFMEVPRAQLLYGRATAHILYRDERQQAELDLRPHRREIIHLQRRWTDRYQDDLYPILYYWLASRDQKQKNLLIFRAENAAFSGTAALITVHDSTIATLFFNTEDDRSMRAKLNYTEPQEIEQVFDDIICVFQEFAQ